MKRYALAIHGGAGLIRRHGLTPEREAACERSLRRILEQGEGLLAAGAAAVDAVEACVIALEDDPLFNAGRGAVFNGRGEIELDAAIMDGRDRGAGAVAMVRTLKNPVRAARAVMTDSPHVLLVGAGAERFGSARGLEQVEPGWFATEERRAQLERARAQDMVLLDHDAEELDVYGTVGAVACDTHGDVAAASSTGGMVNKRPGRVGDTPLIGAGTYAWNETAAIAGTGHGEPFIRLGACGRVSALVELAGLSLDEAAERVIADLEALEGRGGIIAVDRTYALALPFNTGGMFRGAVSHREPAFVAIW